MKKLKKFALLGFLACIVAAFFACGGKELSAPTGISVDEDNRLYWGAVEDARTYTVYVENVETGEVKESSSRKTNFSLSGLEEGYYIIKIKAIGGSQVGDSDWSKVYEFHKDYETGCLYTLINNVEYEITRVGAAAGDVFIEDVYRGKPVTRIADNAFKGSKKIENVVIGNNVTYIGDSAFYNCAALQSVTIPDSVETIGMAAFQSCRSLTDVNLPKGLTEVKEYAFAYCRALTEINLCGASLTKIDNYAFLDCSGLTEIVLPDTLTTLGEYAFSACTEVTKIELSDKLTEIDNYAFNMCEKLTEIKFGDDQALKTIGGYAFSGCTSLESVVLPEGLEVIGYAAFYESEKIAEISIPDSVKQVGAHAFSATAFYNEQVEAGEQYIYVDKWLAGCANGIWEEESFDLKMNDLREDVVGLADQAFANFANLKTVELPQSVRFIGKYTFYNCTNLWKVQTYNVEIIGESAFEKCGSLNRVLFGEGLLEIGSYAFYDCVLLDNSTLAGSSSMIPSTVNRIGTYAFKNTALWKKAKEVVYAGNWVVGMRGLTVMDSGVERELYQTSVVELKDGTAGIADYAFFAVDSLTNVIGLHKVKKIGEGAFYGCTSLTTATLNDNIKEIKDYTFYYCSSLLSVNIPIQLERIGRSAFYKCAQLDTVNLLGSKVDTIGDYAFYQCVNLKSLNLGKRVETIGRNAFYKCISLTEVELSDSVQTLGMKAFAYCENLKSVTLSNSLQSIGTYAFQNCTSLTSVQIPDSVTEIEGYAFYKCTGLTEVTLGSSVEVIGEYAFMNASNVQSLNLPQSVKTIQKYAFKGWSGLTSLVLPSNIERIDDHAFYGCKKATVYTDAANAEALLWSNRWNSTYRPVVWGCTLSEDGAYVVSVKMGENTVFNKRNAELTAPEREGYTFLGWSTKANGNAEYTASELVNVPKGTTVYAVWTEGEPEIQEPAPDVQESATPAPEQSEE